MKRNVLIAICASAMLLTACGSDSHTHSAQSKWESNLLNHWHVCECGEKMDEAEHTMEENVCTVCGTEILVSEDDVIQMTTYDERGNYVSRIIYGADGSVQYKEDIAYTYDDEGNILGQKTYNGDVLSDEVVYQKNAAGERYIASTTHYYEDGSRDVSEYDETWHMTKTVSYDAEDNALYTFEYAYSADGSTVKETGYEGDRLAGEQEYVLLEDGTQRTIRQQFYNADGTTDIIEFDDYGNEKREAHYDAAGNVENELRYESEYDAQGHMTFRCIYQNDRLVEEMEFINGSDEDGEWSVSGKTTVYYEDGSKNVKDGDVEGTWTTDTTYDAAGNVIEELRYEYVYDENGNATDVKGFLNGRLFEQAESIVDAEGKTTGVLMTSYGEDGSKMVREYNANFEVVKETVYDASGNVTSES